MHPADVLQGGAGSTCEQKFIEVLKVDFMMLTVKKLTYSAMALALALVLPFLTGQIQEIGNMLCPMHLPVLLCGFLCGWPWGMAVGFLAPALRFVLFQMPPMPLWIAMSFELAVYGALTGFLYRRLPKRIPYIYFSLIAAMLCGRLVWGAVRFLIAGFTQTTFTFSAFLAGAVTAAVPGILLQLVLIPVLVLVLRRARLTLNEN